MKELLGYSNVKRRKKVWVVCWSSVSCVLVLYVSSASRDQKCCILFSSRSLWALKVFKCLFTSSELHSKKCAVFFTTSLISSLGVAHRHAAVDAPRCFFCFHVCVPNNWKGLNKDVTEDIPLRVMLFNWRGGRIEGDEKLLEPKKGGYETFVM